MRCAHPGLGAIAHVVGMAPLSQNFGRVAGLLRQAGGHSAPAIA